MKKIISLLICLIALSLFTLPAMGEDRQVIQISVPIFGGMLGYEREFSNNTAILLFTDIGFDKGDYGTTNEIFLLGGFRFYNGANNNRYYKGIYYGGEYSAEEDADTTWSSKTFTHNLMGVLGYEWRFGEKKNFSFWVESGINVNVCFGSNMGIDTVHASGFGFNL